MQISHFEQLHDNQLIAGIDEAGRGPWAGPVTSAIVVLNSSQILRLSNTYLNDSKKVSVKRRIEIEILIKEIATDYLVSDISAARIDEINILRATQESMNASYNGLKIFPTKTYIDGVFNIPFDFSDYECVIDGDAKFISIAAASILAKVHRDTLMSEYAKIYPEYGFEKHKGYGTKEHIVALKKFGPCPIHRKSFKPVKQLI